MFRRFALTLGTTAMLSTVALCFFSVSNHSTTRRSGYIVASS